MKKHHALTAYLMVLLPALFFFHQFVIRVWPAAMVDNFMRMFHLDPGSFGQINAAYYYGYAGCQIPFALAFARWKSRTVLGLT